MDFSIDIYLKILNYLNAKSIFKLMIVSTSNRKQLKEILNRRKFIIDLSNCEQITDKGLAYLKGVHTINLSNCKQITDEGLIYLKGVHSINLTWCEHITDKGLAHLKGVQSIDLSCCNRITNEGL